MRTPLLIVLAALAAAIVAARPPDAGPPPVRCGGPPGIQHVSLTVDGEEATGRYAVPRGEPRGLVVFAHGYSHISESWEPHILDTVRDDRVIAVAMDYRGSFHDGEQWRGWFVSEGARDSIAVARAFVERCRLDTVALFGVSMGGHTGALALADRPTRPDGSPLFDVYFHVEGVANIVETYHEARAVAPVNTFAAKAAADIETEMGGTFAEVPEVYLARNPMNRIGDIADSGVAGVVEVHGVDDGLVPYNQGRELVSALRAADVPVEGYTVLTHGPDSEPGTTLTGNVLGPLGLQSPFAGHASEASTTHIVMRTGLDRLSAWLDGQAVACASLLVDGRTDTTTTSPVAPGCSAGSTPADTAS